MAQRVNAINKAFGNCIFINKDIRSVTRTLKKKIAECDVFTETPLDIKMENIDDMHDKLSLTFSNGEVNGVVTWRKTSYNDKHYVFSKFESN